ncbi:tetratricopeptide repeat protein [Saccharothrix carnea]|uniref:Tetratricopeptide repeat protein n=1 Tax=Saccharothrix carnea TaxID=1280637 RepID=A0A2P8H9Z6_SACCR|nr:CHAT domain-containing protein [Saccharothrix carnea]PSL42999.1 tetratricopeptide repeat protein [Saccharothrix carnea]
MDYEPFERCAWAFVRRDYPVAASIAVDVLRTGVSLGMAQILTISLRRMGLSPDDDAIARTLHEAIGDPWESALLDITLGRRDPASVLAEADGVVRRCQALCYVGTHLITTGDLDAGRRHLRECLDLDVECMETQIALMDTDLLDQWGRAAPDVDAEVDRLRRHYHALRSAGHHAQSIHIADAVLRLVVGRHGEFHPETGHSLNELAMAYAATGDWARAEPLLGAALQQVLLFDGASSEVYPTVLDNLAQAKAAQGELDVAEELHRAALESFALAVGVDHPSYATCLGGLALVCAGLGRHDEAERLYREAVDLRRRLFGTDDKRYLGMVDGLTKVYIATGQLRAAEARVAEVVDIVGRLEGTDSPAYGSRLKQLGDLYHQMGRHSDSAARYRTAFTIDHQKSGFDHPTTVDTAARLALAEKLAGRLGEAIRLYRYLQSRQSGADLAVTTHNLAVLHLDTGDTYFARRYAEEAIELHGSAGLEDTVDHALLLIGKAAVDSYQDRYDDAESTLRRAMDLIERNAGRDSEYYANACGALAKCRLAQQRYDEADELLRTSLRLLEAAVGEDAPAIAVTIGLRGTVQLAKGRWDSAEKLFRRAIELLGPAVEAEPTPPYVVLLRDLGSALVGMGREREAIDVLLTVERHQDRLIRERAVVRGISSVAVDQPVALLNLLGRPRFRSPELVSRLVEVVWRRKGIVAEADFVRRREEIHSRQHDGGDVRSKLAELSSAVERGEIPRPAEFEEVVETYARGLRYGMYPEIEAAHRDLHAHIMDGWPEQGDLSREEWLERVSEYMGDAGLLMGNRDRLESDLRTLFHGDGWLGEVLPRVTPDAVRSRLPEGSALVEFLCVPTLDGTAVLAEGGSRWGPDRYYAFVVTPDRDDDVRLVDLGTADRIDANIGLLRRGVTRGGRARDLEPETVAPDDVGRASGEAAVALREALLDPLRVGDRTRLFVAPDAQLYTLPFEILPLEHGRLVIDVHEIAYLTTGRDLIPARRTVPEAAGPPVVVADPDYDLALDATTEPAPADGEPDERRAAGLHFARLPGTHDEGRHVAELLGVTAWLGADAVEGPLKRQRSPVILHIASHGYFLDDDSSMESDPRQDGRRAFSAFPAPLLNSGLALAGANTWLRRGHLPEPAEDGLLTAADLATMDLSGTELVVLSACDTGRGLIAVGQGVYGLRRSVGIAGARTLVMSLWQVPDRETQELMEDFYGRLKRGEPRGSAFRAARLALRARRPDPYYWGAFVCQGDTGPMSASFLGGAGR